MPHFFIPPHNIHGDSFELSGPEVHHLLHVFRHKPGDIIRLFDGTGQSFSARIDSIEEACVRGTIIEQAPARSVGTRIHLYQAVPKGDKFDWLVEKSSELGVASVTPLLTARSVIKEISPAKLDRWKRLALAASKQSGRSDLLQINDPLPFDQAAVALLPGSMNVIPWESEGTRSIPEVLTVHPFPRDIGIFIGPEGGFSVQEIERASTAGIVPVTLGTRIYRAETAGILSSVIVLFLSGEFQ